MSEYERDRNWNFARQRTFSIFLMEEYVKYMHLSGQKKVKWETFDKKMKTVMMKDLQQF